MGVAVVLFCFSDCMTYHYRLRLHEQLCSAEVDKFPRIQMLRTAMQYWKCLLTKLLLYTSASLFTFLVIGLVVTRRKCHFFQRSLNQHTVQSCFARWRIKWLINNHIAVKQEDNKVSI